MTENRAAYLANSPAEYDARRRGVGDILDPLPTAQFRFGQTIDCLEWAWNCQPGQEHAVLDVAAGGGNVGYWARGNGRAPFLYHAVEQSQQQLDMIRGRVEDASLCQWRCEEGGPPLVDALETASDSFLREYPTVLLSHGPEHHADDYRIMDECWSMVRPGGFLLVVSARNDPHRSHFRRYEYLDIISLCAHYAGLRNPVIVWEIDSWADYFVAIPKLPLEPNR